eukprot:m.119987 g.119987  ORF g.119987 m.119987 type:complete len:192 (-) comp14342_c0_seq1:336-911(-)
MCTDPLPQCIDSGLLHGLHPAQSTSSTHSQSVLSINMVQTPTFGTRKAAILQQTCSSNAAEATITFEKDYVLPELLPSQILVKMAFAPINPSDINVLEGTYVIRPESLPAIPGIEGAGIVVKIGTEVSNLDVGAHVCGCKWNWGSWAEYAIANESEVVELPKSLDLKTSVGFTISLFDFSSMRYKTRQCSV